MPIVLSRSTRSRRAPQMLAAVLALTAAASADLIETRGDVDSVTIFRGQALVSRGIDLPGPVGLREIVITELPEFIIPASLYAESSEGLEVRTVSYRMRPLAEDARENVRALDQKIRDVKDRIDGVRAQKSYLEWQRQYLDKLENFLAVTAQIENSRGVLNAETIATMTALLMKQRLEQTEAGRTLDLEVRTLEEQRVLLERERETISLRTSRSAREAVVFVNQTAPNGRLRLNYLVDRASWSPSYNLRAPASSERASENADVTVEYLASIQQMSGEDWTNVRLTLSTATPALVSSAPALGPLAIALAAQPRQSGAAGAVAVGGNYADAKKELARRQIEVEFNRNMGNAPGKPPSAPADALGQTMEVADRDAGGADVLLVFNAQAFAGGDGNRADLSLNEVAAEGQLLDVVSREKIVRQERSKSVLPPPPSEESVSVTYSVASRTSIPSRSDQQLIQIARRQAPSAFYKLATPVLTNSVFDEALVTNASDMVLLAGPSASYAGGEFVGRGVVPTVAVGQTFTAGFGIDTSIRATRDLIERAESTQGGNRVVDFTYRISLENFSKQPVALRLLDRLPNPQGQDIKLTLVSSGAENQPLSTDPAYERTLRKSGILRWDLTVPAERGAADPYTLEYRFQLEYDRQMSIIQR